MGQSGAPIYQITVIPFVILSLQNKFLRLKFWPLSFSPIEKVQKVSFFLENDKGYYGSMINNNNLDGDNRELIGIHVGKYYNIKTGVGL